jgi:hypothetical protein
MNAHLILWPLLAQITLTLGLYVLLARRKRADLRSGTLDRQSTALDSKAWPENTVKVSNNIANQFESPILFYVLCLSFFVLNAVSLPVLALAWLFILLRCVHAYIHTGSNYVPRRMKVFILGTGVLLVMTALLAYQLALLSL